MVIEEYEALAVAMVAIYASGEPSALDRFNRHYERSVTVDDFRAMVWHQMYKVRQAKGAPDAFGIPEAQEMIARNAGFGNWGALIASAKGTGPPAVPAYSRDAKARLSIDRDVNESDWLDIIAAAREHSITGVEANGRVTDAALRQITSLETVTTLRLGSSRELSDDGLLQLAAMPWLEELDLSEYPGGKLTDRGLEVLRSLPNLRRFEMTWQRGVSDAGLANLRHCDKLEVVNLMGAPCGDGVIRALSGKPALRRLSTGRLVTDAGLAALREIPLFQTWSGDKAEGNETFLLIDGPFTNNGLTLLRDMEGIASLDLFWHVDKITPDGFAVLREMPHLVSLGCDGKLSNNRAMRHIGAMPGLRRLRAQGSTATDTGFIALSRSRTLEKFWGREAPKLTGKGFVSFAEMPSLQALGVSLKNVDDEALSQLKRFPALRELTPIDVQDDGFRHVGECEKLERLSCMYCRDTTDIATGHVAGLRLMSYYAGLTKITDKSLEILSGMDTLERIELFETKSVSDAGLTHLARLPRLREVSFSGLPHVTFWGTSVFRADVDVKFDV